jgi:hypothetical protein
MYHAHHKPKTVDMLIVQTCAAGFCLGMVLLTVAGVIVALETMVAPLV